MNRRRSSSTPSTARASSPTAAPGCPTDIDSDWVNVFSDSKDIQSDSVTMKMQLGIDEFSLTEFNRASALIGEKYYFIFTFHLLTCS